MSTIGAVRAWLLAVPGLGLTESQVLIGPVTESRPPLPYLVVTELSPGSRDGRGDERLYTTASGNPAVAVRGQRRAVVEVQGYGAATLGWLQEAELALPLPSVQAAVDAEDSALELQGELLAIDQQLGTGWEKRYLLTVDVHYTLTTGAPGPEQGTELLTAQVTHTLQKTDIGEADPGALVDNITAPAP